LTIGVDDMRINFFFGMEHTVVSLRASQPGTRS
jgi:hypothetical protein